MASAKGGQFRVKVPLASVEPVFVTPEMAHAWLKTNANFRPLNRRRVQQFARVLQEGRWKLDGATIVFDNECRLIDGQHRLSGAVAAGIGFLTFVVYNIEGTCPDKDLGVARSLTDFLARQMPRFRAGRLSSSLRLLWAARHFGTQSLCWLCGTGGVAKPFISELLDLHAEVPGLYDHIEMARRSTNLIPESQLGVLHYLFGTVGGNPDAADDYVAVLSGKRTVERPQEDAVSLLRARLIEDRMKNTGRQLDPAEVRALAIKAWNKWAKDEPCRVLKMVRTGLQAEELPEILPWGPAASE